MMNFMAALRGDDMRLPSSDQALPGRQERMAVPARHFVNGHSLEPPFPAGTDRAVFAMGCFWGAERLFWEIEGVHSTAAGYIAGRTPNPTYEEICSGLTGHTEAVLVVFDPRQVSYEALLRAFWENHDPTQGMRQGADIGTEYRSGIYYSSDAQREAADRTRETFQAALSEVGYSVITSEIAAATEFYYAEDYHQQYLAKNPNGYCEIGGVGVSCPTGIATSE